MREGGPYLERGHRDSLVLVLLQESLQQRDDKRALGRLATERLDLWVPTAARDTVHAHRL